jgi:hypothetical protein
VHFPDDVLVCFIHDNLREVRHAPHLSGDEA